MTRKESNRRLLKLARFLDKVPAKRFDYGSWTRGVGTVDPVYYKAARLRLKGTKQECGTTGCALGWATAVPEFRKLGLYLTGFGTPEIQTPRGNCVRGEDAGVELFGLKYTEALDLFMPQNAGEDRATAKYVARKIRKFVKERV